jgi:alpha-2-macroglobulin-like protein
LYSADVTLSQPVDTVAPPQIAKGDGQVVVTIDDAGVREQSSKTLPILLQAVDVDIYGESGDIIAGLPNRVYVEATAPSGDPADITAVIFDTVAGAPIANVTTTHEGRGVSGYFVPDGTGLTG